MTAGASAARALRAAFVAAATLAAAAAMAAPQQYAIDPARSSVEFRIRYLGLFTPGGRFGRLSGVIVFDPDHWETLEVTIQIPVDSLESRPEFWRSDLLGPRFFDVSRFPTIALRASGAVRTTPEAGEASGSLTLHGTTRQTVLRARIRPGDGALEVEGEARISRADFGFAPTLPFASDQVTVTMTIRAVRAVP